ncbi:uncharacterized protein LOC110466851 [Mizuhopecten yessoensis]|uniref:Uncharacterized protein n=1 Tax=Mizuhopecten yessoensis TaxID=6573 RepID=A0A210PN73_MIZYE|nr:uncharacterized protein LOC110466851 [Mizuhopecten yessoensis]OWF37917.1 hypothetical protein KP79_PYT14237 [Mizuhopecten yessoensis]
MDKTYLIGLILTLLMVVSYEGATATNRKYVTYSDRKAARDRTVHVEDNFLRFVLERQTLFCPSVSTCTLSYSMSSDDSCCAPCSCNVTAAPLDHCPDYVREEIRTACLNPQYINKWNKTKSSRESYFMINRCPTSYDDASIGRLCVRGHSLYPYNISMVLPVTDAANDLTYRNVFCAVCNSRLERDLVAWSGKLNCSSQSTLDPKTMTELLEIVANDDQCNVLFEPPIHMTLAKCNTHGLISECNVTGQWSVFDEDLDRACTSYRSVYRDAYQNIFCFLCNVNEEPFKTCDRTDNTRTVRIFPNPPVTTFSAALEPIMVSDLRFRHDIVSVCPSGTRYDGIKKTCRVIVCSHPLVNRNGICTTVYQFVNLRRYSVNLVIYPHYNTSYKWLNNPWLANHLNKFSMEYLTMALSPWQVHQCSSGAISIIKTRLRDVFPRDNETQVIYVKVPTDFIVEGIYNDVTVMKQFINSKIKSNNITIRNDDIYFDMSLLTYAKMDRLSKEPVFINGLELKEIMPMPSSHAQNGDMLCRVRMPTFELSSFTLCPKINISIEDYNATRVNDSLCLSDLDLCYSPDEFEYSDLDILLCSERFFEKIDKLVSNNGKNNTHTLEENTQRHVGLVLVCLSIVCLGVTLVGMAVTYRPRTLMSSILLGLVVCLLLYNIVLLSVPFPFVSTYSCRVSGASLHFTSTLSVAFLQLCGLHVGLMMRANRHFQNPYILKLIYVSYPAIMAPIIVSVTYWYVVNQSSFVMVPWIPWGLPCYYDVNSLSLYISCFPILTMLTLTFLVFLVLAIYSYIMSFEVDDVEFVHLFGFYCKISFMMLLVHSFWFLISYSRWVGNIYIFLVSDLVLSLYLMLCSLTDSKLKATCTSTVETSDTNDLKRNSSCPCNPARRRQPKDFRPISEAVSEKQNDENRKTSCHL